MTPSLAKAPQKALLSNLSESISAQNKAAAYACGGSLDQAVQIRFGEDGQGRVVDLPKDSAESNSFQALIQACAPATFGLGNKDVLDEEYRKASELNIDQFATAFCPYKAGIIDVIAQVLVPNISTRDSEKRGVRAELYKINFYSAPSGKFKSHVDTPRSVDQFGSLVVCLPVAHAGRRIQSSLTGASTDRVCSRWATSSPPRTR